MDGGETSEQPSSASGEWKEDLSSEYSLFPEAEMSPEERLWRRIFDWPSPSKEKGTDLFMDP